MQFAVALIEYLISGVVASAWLTAVFANYYPLLLHTIHDYKEFIIIIYLPIAYILGIYVDTTSSFFIRRWGEITKLASKAIILPPSIRDTTLAMYRTVAGTPKEAPYKKGAAILAFSPSDAIRTMEAYISRDRIARGATFNSFAGAVTALCYAPPEHKFLVTIICSIACVYSYMMHRRLSRLSSSFKKVALANLQMRTPTEAGKLQASTIECAQDCNKL